MFNLSIKLYDDLAEIANVDVVVVHDTTKRRDWGLIENVRVDEGHRREGIASRMMAIAEEAAKQFGCYKVKLTSRKAAGKELYRKLGYEEGSSFHKDLQGEE